MVVRGDTSKSQHLLRNLGLVLCCPLPLFGPEIYEDTLHYALLLPLTTLTVLAPTKGVSFSKLGIYKVATKFRKEIKFLMTARRDVPILPV